MKSKSLSKNLATVIVFVFGLVTPAMSVEYVETKETIILKGKQERVKTLEAECKKIKDDMLTAKGSFLSYCKEEFHKKINDTKSTENQKKAILECSEEFTECQSMGKDEMDFGGFMSGMTGQDAMPSFPFGSETSKRCSKYTVDKLDSAIEKATTALDTKKTKLQDMTEKNMKSEADLKEKYDDMQKKFIEEQEAKAKATMDSKENKRNQQAAFDKQKGEYEAMIRKTESEIFQMQQQAALMSQQRGKEINTYKIALLQCKAQVRKMKSENTGVTSNLSSAQQSDARIVWASCASNALQDRNNEAAKYRVAMESIERNLQYKMAELAALQQSAQKLSTMFAEAAQDQAAHETQQEQAFLQKQQQSWLQMSDMTKKMQQKNIQNQQFLSDADQEVKKASNKLLDLQSEEARGDKPISEAKTGVMRYQALQETHDVACKAAQDAATDLKNAEGQPAAPAATTK